MSIDSHFDVYAILHRVVDEIHELCCSDNITVLKDSASIFSRALQNLNAIMEYDSALAAKAESLEEARVVEESAAACMAGKTIEKMDIFWERDDGSRCGRTSQNRLADALRRYWPIDYAV